MNAPTPRPGGDYEKELIDHLSKEIVCQSELMMTFRTRVSFVIWLGPFIVVGALLVATKEVPSTFDPGALGWACLGGAAALYFALGVVLQRIETHTWDQCNVWRQAIVGINAGLSAPLSEDRLVFRHNLKQGYWYVALVILMIFILLSAGAWQVVHRATPSQPPPLQVNRYEPCDPRGDLGPHNIGLQPSAADAIVSRRG